MQNSNLTSKIFPNLRDDWSSFIELVSIDLRKMIDAYNDDNNTIKNHRSVIKKMAEIRELSKNNPGEILNHRDLIMHINNSKELDDSFNTLKFFKERDNLDNPAVKDIYNKIINSPNIVKLNSEYNSLTIKVAFDEERIKRLSALIRGSKVDYNLIRELLNKYKLSDEKKKNILFYPVVMLSIKQNEIKNNKENALKIKQEKEMFYKNQFNKLVKDYYEKKDNYKDLLVKCFNVRSNMSRQDLDTYSAYANNPEEINEYEINDEIKFKIYTLAFFKIKKDIENYIDGIIDSLPDDIDLDDELIFFQEMINEFGKMADKLKSFIKVEEKISDDIENNVFFAINAFGQIIANDYSLITKNKSNIKAILQKANNISNSRIDGIKTSHMLGVEESERILGKNISLLVTSKIMLAYVIVGKNILIIAGDTNGTTHFDKVVNRTIEHYGNQLRAQIKMIEEDDLDYIESQKERIKSFFDEEIEKVI